MIHYLSQIVIVLSRDSQDPASIPPSYISGRGPNGFCNQNVEYEHLGAMEGTRSFIKHATNSSNNQSAAFSEHIVS